MRGETWKGEQDPTQESGWNMGKILIQKNSCVLVTIKSMSQEIKLQLKCKEKPLRILSKEISSQTSF